MLARLAPRTLANSLSPLRPTRTLAPITRSLMSSAPALGPVEQAIRQRVRPRPPPPLSARRALAHLVVVPHTQLEESLQPTTLDITNDSSKHRHHAPMKAIGGGDGETHFTVSVVSERFEGMVSSPSPSLSRSPRAHADASSPCAQRVIQRHRLVNDALKPLFDAGLHALAIRAKSPKEVGET